MSWIHENQRQGLMLLSRCVQKPGLWIAERISTGQMDHTIQALFTKENIPKELSSVDFLCLPPAVLTDLLSQLEIYQDQAPENIQKELVRQYVRWSTIETKTMAAATSSSPFKETQDPLLSYRHLPGQEIMEWYHCCGMKMPKRFVGRPDSIHMKLEFAVYLIGNIQKHPDDPDHKKTYQAFLRRFLLPHIDRILAHRCGSEQFPFYYSLCATIQAYLT